jgi:hypothetical protein
VIYEFMGFLSLDLMPLNDVSGYEEKKDLHLGPTHFRQCKEAPGREEIGTKTRAVACLLAWQASLMLKYYHAVYHLEQCSLLMYQ